MFRRPRVLLPGSFPAPSPGLYGCSGSLCPRRLHKPRSSFCRRRAASLGGAGALGARDALRAGSRSLPPPFPHPRPAYKGGAGRPGLGGAMAVGGAGGGRRAAPRSPPAPLALLWLLLCAPGRAGGRLLTVADLFDRVIRHSGRIHSLSTALYAELEKRVPPRDNELGRPARRCHTSGMLTPNGKEYAQKIPREELTLLILKLLQAWKEPLSHFNQHIEHHQELPDDSLSKAKQISNMVHELKTGVEKVTEKMQSMGIISNSLNGMESSEDTGLSNSNEANMMSDSDFIHCFRRDSNKVQSYLKILKCRIMPENSC
ncbi:prolactin-like [Phaenicophaeus curvirostris]|uniref:prolactin-like n=1 Tax=Phaenicophaeus curvirostris TaxID=33595 RepID=UPI0037F0A976